MLIHDADLPREWTVLPRSENDAAAIEAALTHPEVDDDRPGEVFEWVHIRNTRTGETAWLRAHHEYTDKSVTISGLAFLPESPGERLNNRTVRALPLAGIENAATSRRLQQRLLAAYQHHTQDEGWDPADPLGAPRDNPNFYERVARQFLTLKDAGEQRPVARMVEINMRPAKTVQGWVTEARKRGLLPPGRRGKAG